VRVFTVVAVVASGTLHWPLAAGGPVKMVTDVVPLVFGTPALRGRPAARRCAAAPSSRSASPRRLSVAVVLPSAAVKFAAGPQLESVPLLHEV